MTLGVNLRVRPLPRPGLTEFRQLDHLDGAGTVRQAADEAALLQRRDEPVDAGFGTQIESVLHLVEGGRHAGLLQTLVNEAQQLELLAGQHPWFSEEGFGRGGRKQIMNGHYMFHMCSATL